MKPGQSKCEDSLKIAPGTVNRLFLRPAQMMGFSSTAPLPEQDSIPDSVQAVPAPGEPAPQPVFLNQHLDPMPAPGGWMQRHGRGLHVKEVALSVACTAISQFDEAAAKTIKPISFIPA